MATRQERLKASEHMLKAEYNEGFKHGLQGGLRTAQRIFCNYSANHKLETPHTNETLEEWARKDLEALRLAIAACEKSPE